jgi:hypothetical protein
MIIPSISYTKLFILHTLRTLTYEIVVDKLPVLSSPAGRNSGQPDPPQEVVLKSNGPWSLICLLICLPHA